MVYLNYANIRLEVVAPITGNVNVSHITKYINTGKTGRELQMASMSNLESKNFSDLQTIFSPA